MLSRVLRVCALVAVALPVTHVAQHVNHRRSDVVAGIDSIVSSLATMDSFSGVVLFARAGDPVYKRAVGMANRESGAMMTSDTKLQIASATKLFTQIAIRQLEQAGKLSLGDTVGKFLPHYRNPVVRSRVTVEQLLRHRSGVGSFWNARYLSHLSEIRSVNDYIALFDSDSLLFPPGTSEVYSNGGYVLLGAIIEHVSGQSYHDYLREHVFGPASMTETAPYDSRAPRTNAAIGYTLQPLGGPPSGDTRLAGPARRPGYESRGDTVPGPVARTPGDSLGPTPPNARLRIVGADGRELTQEEARTAMARRAASGAQRRPNTSVQASMSGPAGGHYSTVGDFLELAEALKANKLLDSTRTAAVLGQRYATGADFRASGGGPGTNVEFSLFQSGEVVVVFSNYDPPASTTIAEFVRKRLAPQR